MNTSSKLKIGISACLLGEKVRFDGGHKEDRYLTRTLSYYVEWVPVCPEVEMGLPVPRENLRLVVGEEGIRLVGGKSKQDFTEQMQSWAQERLAQLSSEHLHGYILKRSSPSCGMERVRVYDTNSVPQKNGVGIYARMLMERYPLLPVEEEGRLNDSILLENFIERIFAYYRLQDFLKNQPTKGKLVNFHTAYKLTLMAHSPTNAVKLGRLVARMTEKEFDTMLLEYAELFMHTLRRKATPKKHANVLQHVLGYFKKLLDSDDRAECLQLIEQYRLGYVPLIVPLTLLKHHLRRHPIAWLQNQVYFNPYPEELMLRNRV